MSKLTGTDDSGYQYQSAEPGHAAAYLWPEVERVARLHAPPPARLFDLGCGNGAFAARLAALGYDVCGADVSPEGIEQARRAHPGLSLHLGSAYDDLSATYGTFPVVTSLEVVEHVYAPRTYASTLFSLVAPGGVAIISTPYHGYLKNLALAATGKLDAHFTALWDHGHIKFWSVDTLGHLLQEAGFDAPRFERVGRVPTFAKSMIAIACRP